MRPNKYYVILSLFMLFALAYCGDKNILYEDPLLLQSEEFTFIPEAPKTNDVISMVYYGCGYNVTTLVKINAESILVKKHFNGSMKRPCILEHDTILFGKLTKGNYLVTLEIIDINPFAQDSLFHKETKTLIVGQ